MMRRAIRSWNLFFITAFLLQGVQARACMWDSTTLRTERRRHPKLAEVVLGQPAKPEKPGPLRERIRKLLANKQEDNPAWLNDLAGAHMRLGELKEAVALLEPGVKKFPNDYGVHANLGTAYHLQGRYEEAEREIARDLEINPEAHFGLEKYHLALLQYLIRDEGYRSRHVYVDEFTVPFLQSSAHMLQPSFSNAEGSKPENDTEKAELAKLEEEYRELAKKDGSPYDFSKLIQSMMFYDEPAPYMEKWNLARDPKLEEGVIYMATLNPKEPACFQMLGILCLKKFDRNLTAAAYEKAIALGSPQTQLLRVHANELKTFIKKSKEIDAPYLVVYAVAGVIIIFYIYTKIRDLRKKRSEGVAV
ncbi:MAG: hypothetical protein JWQ71_3915 [Pedosphaera sp.]|nr:hypothetical protein [Pedosphaera sp.]